MVRQVITEEIWLKLQPLLPKPKGRHGKYDRQFLEVVSRPDSRLFKKRWGSRMAYD